jgi:glycolate oxidase iron-sulfur subunit
MDPSLIDDCVHCGFCLPTCPTYELWHEEMDSPRGRIWLMRATLDGTVELNQTVAEHFDRCLGCMACLTSCPSGVKYDQLIELARERVEQEVPRPWRDRLLRSAVFAVFPHPKRLRFALRFSGLPAPGPFKPLKALAPRWRESVSPPAETPAIGERVARVGLLTGCVQSVIFGEVNRASARVLSAYGYEVATPYGGCCGALALHSGRRQEGMELARRTAAAFEAAGCETIVTNAAGCGSHLKEAGLELPVVDISEALVRGRAPEPSVPAEKGDVDVHRHHGDAAMDEAPRLHPLELRVAFQESCHLGHAQRVRDEPRALLRSIPGVELVEPAEQHLCCGSAGIYNLVQPEAALELGDRKAQQVIATEPDLYVSANPGCLLQVSAALRRAGRATPAAHPVELLDASIRGAPPPLRV